MNAARSAGVGACGEGANLYSGTGSSAVQKEGRKEGTSLPPSIRPETDTTLADVLLEVGAYVLHRPKRIELADKLTAIGMDAADVYRLRDYLAGCITDQEQAKRQMVAVLLDVERLPTAMEDLAKHLRKREAKSAPKAEAPKQHPGESIRRQNAERLAEMRALEGDAHLAAVVVALRIGDRKPLDAIAAELGIAKERAAQFLALHVPQEAPAAVARDDRKPMNEDEVREHFAAAGRRPSSTALRLLTNPQDTLKRQEN